MCLTVLFVTLEKNVLLFIPVFYLLLTWTEEEEEELEFWKQNQSKANSQGKLFMSYKYDKVIFFPFPSNWG